MKLTNLKFFLTILFSSLYLITTSQAEDARDLQVEGISIGDNLTKYMSKEEIFKYPECLDQNIIQLDKKFIDFNFHTYMRHEGNKDHARQYLKWEIDLLDKMDKQEINFFKIGNINAES